MIGLRQFNYNDEQITAIIDENNEIWFVASHICKILKHTNVTQRLKDHCDPKGVRKTDTLTNGGIQNLLVINEPNLYRLIFRSKVSGAKAFQDWIVEDVIPTIRKTGKYEVSVKEKSKETRTAITSEWKRQGVAKSFHYKNLTLKEYEALGFPKELRKPAMNENELRELMALEAIELIRLSYQNRCGYYGVKEQIEKSSEDIKNIKKSAIKNTNITGELE